jgi:hypothetical protein
MLMTSIRSTCFYNSKCIIPLGDLFATYKSKMQDAEFLN